MTYVEPATIEVGTALPELVITADPTFVISTALATRDFQDVHHDRDKAVARGSKDIFVNILTDTGLVQRFVTDWAGPRAIVKSVALRLGVPLYGGDTLTLSGTVSAIHGKTSISMSSAATASVTTSRRKPLSHCGGHDDR